MAKLTRKQIREGFDQIPIDGLLFGTAAATAAEAKLTPKQREFARMIALGESKAGAYRKAYNSKGKPKTQANNAYTLTRRRDIAEVTEAFKQAIQFSESHTPAQIRAFVIQQLTQHAQDEEIPPAQRIKSLELLGKVAEVGAFVDRKEVVNVQSSQTIRERLLEKLAASGRTIEHKAEDEDAASLMAELTPPTLETAETDTHPTPTPGISGGNVVEDAHIIPHKQSALDPNMDIVDAEWTEQDQSTDSSVSAYIADAELPLEDGGLEASAALSPQQTDQSDGSPQPTEDFATLSPQLVEVRNDRV